MCASSLSLPTWERGFRSGWIGRFGLPAPPLEPHPEPPRQRADRIAEDRGAERDGEDAERDRPRRMMEPEQHPRKLARRLARGGGIRPERLVVQFPGADPVGGVIHGWDGDRVDEQ